MAKVESTVISKENTAASVNKKRCALDYLQEVIKFALYCTLGYQMLRYCDLTKPPISSVLVKRIVLYCSAALFIIQPLKYDRLERQKFLLNPGNQLLAYLFLMIHTPTAVPVQLPLVLIFTACNFISHYISYRMDDANWGCKEIDFFVTDFVMGITCFSAYLVHPGPYFKQYPNMEI